MRSRVKVGQRSGHLTAVKIIGKSGREGKKYASWLWERVCDCGEVHNVCASHFVNKRIRSCGKCGAFAGPNHAQFTGRGKITGEHWSSILRGARGDKARNRRVIPMSISIEDAWQKAESQQERCAYTGQLLVFYPNDQRTASLDRIDSSDGYHIHNIQWVHKDINMMKRTLTSERFVALCRAVAEWSPS